MNTPKAFANLSPGFERSENPGVCTDDELKPCKGLAVGELLQGLILIFISIPGLLLRSNPGLKLANAFGVFIQFKLRGIPKHGLAASSARNPFKQE